MCHQCCNYRTWGSQLCIIIWLPPFSISLGVDCLVAEWSWSTLTRLESSITVQTKFQPFWMNVIGQRKHTTRKIPIRHNDSSTIPRCLPTVIQIHILVTFGSQSRRDQKVSSLLDEILIDATAKVIPAVPTHWRCQTNTVIQCRNAYDE